MSRARMDELKSSLEDSGWLVSCENEEHSLFFVDGERIEWKLLRSRDNCEVGLVFYLFDPLGNRTEKLSDILYVKECKGGRKLYFGKINSKLWKAELKQFVRDLY